MALDPVTNFAKVTVSTGYSAADVSVALSSGDGSKLPDPSVDGAFNLVWYNATDYPDPSDDPNVEIVRCTARSGDTLTVTRAQEGTAASIKDLAGKTYKMLLAATEKTIGDVADRANHTGTQPASTISDFDAEVSNNADVAANTAARHSHGNSEILVATTASFLAADESKLDAIETGADVTDAGNVGSSIQGVSGKTTPVDADTLPLIDSAASNVLKKVSWGNVKATLKAYFDTLYQVAFGYKTCITVGFSNADYITDGTADDVQINAALAAVNTAGGGEVYLKPGTYQLANIITLKPNVTFRGAGVGQSIITISSGFAAGVIAREQSGAAHNLSVCGISFDASGKADVGHLHIYQGDNVSVHDNEFKNQAYSSASKWATRIGNFSDADPAGTQSSGCRFYNNILESNDCGTYEQLLFVNQSSGYVQDNIFRNNTNSLAYELMLYVNGDGVECSGNVFDSPSAHSIGIMESTKVHVHENTFQYDASFNCVTVINSKQLRIERNIAENTQAGNTGAFVAFFDRALGPDGFTQLVGDTQDVSVSKNSATGFKYFAIAQIAGTVLSTDYTMGQSGLVFDGNEIRDSLSVPFLLGISDATNLMKNVYIRNNNVYSWVGGLSGAIQLRGYSSDVTQMADIYINGNYIAPPTDGSTNGAVRVIGATVAEVSNNKFTGIATPITTATGGVVTRQFNNLGTTSNQIPGIDAQSSKITSVANPASAQDAATKSYVDGLVAPDATSSVNGKVRLTGDLGGTASAPTTPTAVHITGTETIGGAKTFTSNVVITNAAPSLSFTESDQTAPAGAYRIDGSGDLMRFIRSSTVLATLGAQGLSLLGALTTALATKTSAYTLAATDSIILADAASGAITLTLPTAVGITGHQYTVKKIDASANVVTVDGNGSQTIDGSATHSLTAQYQSIIFVSDGANWCIVGRSS